MIRLRERIPAVPADEPAEPPVEVVRPQGDEPADGASPELVAAVMAMARAAADPGARP